MIRVSKLRNTMALIKRVLINSTQGPRRSIPDLPRLLRSSVIQIQQHVCPGNFSPCNLIGVYITTRMKHRCAEGPIVYPGAEQFDRIHRYCATSEHSYVPSGNIRTPRCFHPAHLCVAGCSRRGQWNKVDSRSVSHRHTI